MKLLLYHAKNPDLMYGQGNGTGYWVEPIDPRKMVIEVADLSHARQALRDWVERNELGCGNMAADCGDVIVDGRIVARISFNGRVWAPYRNDEWQDWVELLETS